jgi:rRNA maturation protein Nop10
MKRALKISITVLAFSTLAIFAACNNSSAKKTEETNSAKMEMTHEGGDHVYACPMHPEVTGKEGDECPKCGMKLEHNDHAGAASNVFMQFSTHPATVNPNQEVTLSMTPKMKDKADEQVPLDVEHTKKIHLIVVNDDLSWFDHIHPEFNADGSYTVKEKFPAPGKFTLFADYKPSGGSHVVDNLNVTVAGTAPAAKKYGADKLTSAAGDGFSVSLTPEGGKFLTNMAMHINGVVMLNDKETDITTLEDYLGAKVHMVVISLADKKYLHVHPSVKGGRFDLHTTFDKPGIYRGWIQFQSKSKIYTSDFTMNVAGG